MALLILHRPNGTDNDTLRFASFRIYLMTPNDPIIGQAENGLDYPNDWKWTVLKIRPIIVQIVSGPPALTLKTLNYHLGPIQTTVQFDSKPSTLWPKIFDVFLDSYLSGLKKFFKIFISDEFLIFSIFWIDKLGRGITANDSMRCPSWPSPTKPKLRDVKVMKIRKFSKILNFTYTMPSTTKNELFSTHSFLQVGN